MWNLTKIKFFFSLNLETKHLELSILKFALSFRQTYFKIASQDVTLIAIFRFLCCYKIDLIVTGACLNDINCLLHKHN